MQVAFWATPHSLRNPIQQILAAVVAILYRIAFVMIKVQTSDTVHCLECRKQGRHKGAKGKNCDGEIIGIGAWHRLWEIGESWVLGMTELQKPSEDRIKRHNKQKTTRRAALSHTSGHEELSPGFACKFNIRHAVAIDHVQELPNKDGQLRLSDLR